MKGDRECTHAHLPLLKQKGVWVVHFIPDHESYIYGAVLRS